jgi:3D (Asp-Asp-Asp) domain-containing protein
MKTKQYIFTGIIALVLSSCASAQKYVNKVIHPKAMDIRVTAYHCKESDHLKYKNKSAIGSILQKGKSIAADWSIFPVGTKMKFNNHIYEVCDFGSALIKPPNQIPTVDLYVANKKEMNAWGTRFIDNVEIVEWGSYARSAEILKDRLKYWHCRTMYTRIQAKL